MSSNDEYPPRCLSVPVPTSFSCLDFGAHRMEYETHVISIVQNGFVISSPVKLKIGGTLSLRLTMPESGHAQPNGEMRCTGRVTEEEAFRGLGLEYRVEIELARYPRSMEMVTGQAGKLG